jgi:hypothetical protein
MDLGGTAYTSMVDDDFPRDITVLSTKSEIQNKDFRRATIVEQIYNHHNAFVEVGKIAPAVYGCSTKSLENKASRRGTTVFTAGANEQGEFNYYAELDGKLKSSYYLKKDRVLMNTLDVVNYAEQDQVVYTATEIEYLEGHPANYIDALLHDIEPGICGGPSGNSIHPPQGVKKFSVNATGIEVLRSGYIVNIQGHMHDGGDQISLKINGKEACLSKALYGGPEHTTIEADGKKVEFLRKMTDCQSIKVQKGDRIDFQAYYDLDLHPS